MHVPGRASGSFARPAMMPCRNGSAAASAGNGSGASFTIWYSICPREKGGAPVRHSYAIAANEYTSCAGFGARPRSCSGLMYSSVPLENFPVTRVIVSWISRAMPKSSTNGVPSLRTITFPGFTSRWTTPCECA